VRPMQDNGEESVPNKKAPVVMYGGGCVKKRLEGEEKDRYEEERVLARDAPVFAVVQSKVQAKKRWKGLQATVQQSLRVRAMVGAATGGKALLPTTRPVELKLMDEKRMAQAYWAQIRRIEHEVEAKSKKRRIIDFRKSATGKAPGAQNRWVQLASTIDPHLFQRMDAGKGDPEKSVKLSAQRVVAPWLANAQSFATAVAVAFLVATGVVLYLTKADSLGQGVGGACFGLSLCGFGFCFGFLRTYKAMERDLGLPTTHNAPHV